MKPSDLLGTAIVPALTRLKMDSPAARRFMLAIALQESRLAHRRQVSADGSESGPASSYWQFEKNGGCRGVITHRDTGPIMRRVCEDFDIDVNALSLWEAMRYQDVVAACAARLLIYTLPAPLPETAMDGWAQYISAWRPGKPHPDTWVANWALAHKSVPA